MKATLFGWLVLLLALAAPLPASAEDEDEETEESGDEGEDQDEGEDDGDDESEGGEEEDGEGSEDSEGDDASESEAEGDAPAAEARSWFFGPYFRYAVLPAFLLEAFLDEAPTVDNAAFGIVANKHNPEGASFELGLGYAPYAFDGPMRASGDPDEDTEWIESDLGLIHATASILWSVPIAEPLSFEYGLGIDLGLLIGELKRTEAYKSGGEYRKCPGVVPVPQPASTYCEPPRILPTDPYDAEGAHYNVIEERVPGFGASLMLPHLALRYTPIPEVALKLEAALGFPTSFIGLSAAYGPEL